MNGKRGDFVALLSSVFTRDAAVFGEDSELCKELRWAAENVKFQELADQLELIQLADLMRVLPGDIVDRESTPVLEGLKCSLRAARQVRGSKDSSSHIAEAIQHFNHAWATGGPVPVVADGSAILGRSPVEEALAGATNKRTTLGYWIVHDLLERWTDPARGQLAALHATTPILGSNHFTEDGAVLWLTVELFHCQGGGPFCPDPWHLGLTAITNPAAERSFARAMEDVWRLSGLWKWFRGRWRITHQHPGDATKRYTAAELERFRCLAGRSAQIAALCAVLAASGDPYRENPDERPTGKAEPLASDVAVSACVDNDHRDETKPLAQLPVGKVESVPEKLIAAKHLLDTVVLAEQQGELSHALREARTAQDEARGRQEQYSGLHVEYVASLGEALDLMLVTNRHLARYGDSVRERCLCQWEKDTAKSKADPREWTGAMAEQAWAKWSRRNR